jgi:hypothetical protein
MVTGVRGVTGLFSGTFLKSHSFTGYRGEGVGRELRGRAWALGEIVGVLFMFFIVRRRWVIFGKGRSGGWVGRALSYPILSAEKSGKDGARRKRRGAWQSPDLSQGF